MTNERKHFVDTFIDTIVNRYGRELISFLLGIFTAGILITGIVSFRFFKPPSITYTASSNQTFISNTENISPSPKTSITLTAPLPTVTENIDKDKKVDLNTASKSELESLPGIGPALTERIIAQRPYKSISDLQKVSGIGIKKYDAVKDHITVGQ